MTDRPARPARLLAAALVAAPLLTLASELVVPRDNTENPVDELALIADHSGAFLAADLMYFAAMVLFAVGIRGVMGLVTGRGRTFVRVAGSMAFLGAVALAAHAVLLLALRDLALAPDRTAMAAANGVISEGNAAIVVLVLHLFGFDLGLTLFTVAAWRARLVPAWAAPLGFLCLAGDFSPGSYNGVLLGLAATAAFSVLASGVLRRTGTGSVAAPTPVPAAA
ncbi:hypothetical protein [Micromonospora sp. WMMD812]|uniref:hypothetical protein n=1 Tax=Micromonospora sp. WMMD812 TaxID=3015152 RepID=UPI00248B82ED|nr:hypothetical protein [Micromonospora sp. WMMD812]WBB65101.1 hypothetical protein O7603_17930 [Micromonospora sp. WMMD812]